MDTYRNLAVIIPALNESPTVGGIVDEVRRLGCDVYVVNDCSDDDTREKALNAGAKVLSLPFVSGAWNAVQAGLSYAVKQGRYDLYLTMDADGQHDPLSISVLMAARAATGANVVIGSCPERGSMTRRCAWTFFSFLTRLKIRDITSGLRLYDSRAARSALSGEAILYDYQDLGVLLLLRRRGLTCTETPVVMRQRQTGSSRVFSSWAAVAAYMVKTGIGVLADWVAAGRVPEEREEYDAF